MSKDNIVAGLTEELVALKNRLAELGGIDATSTKDFDHLPFVIIRTYSAGVHVGFLESHTGTEVTLRHSRRLYKWTGSLSLSEVSMRGPGSGAMVCTPLDTIILTQAIEIIPVGPGVKTVFLEHKTHEI